MPRNDCNEPMVNIATSEKNKCIFCNSADDNELKFGKIYEHDGLVTHYYCLLLSSNMQQRGEDEDGILGFLTEDIQKELKRGKRLVCAYCKKKGATLGCCNTKCKKIFHYPCGLKSGSLHQFFDEYRSYCVSHRPRYKAEERFCASLGEDLTRTSENSTCYICLDSVNRSDKFQTLWASCCKKNAWFHRDCVQQLAMSAGYFFKCPLCNNKKEFQKAMLDRGIFIPSQDASWELVPHAFEELLHRHNRCDAELCRCPKGRIYSNASAKWKLILCRTCGSQGIHIACGKLKRLKPIWDCTGCSSILNKNNDNTTSIENSSSSNSSHFMDSSSSNSTCSTSSVAKNNYNVSDDDDDDDDNDDDRSDSDISVGVETPAFNFPLQTVGLPVKIRPGPRSFKIKQQEIIIKSTNSTIDGCSSGFIGPRPETSDSDSSADETPEENNSKKIIDDIIIIDSDDEAQNKQPISSSVDNDDDNTPPIEYSTVENNVNSPESYEETPSVFEKKPSNTRRVIETLKCVQEFSESNSASSDPVFFDVSSKSTSIIHKPGPKSHKSSSKVRLPSPTPVPSSKTLELSQKNIELPTNIPESTSNIYDPPLPVEVPEPVQKMGNKELVESSMSSLVESSISIPVVPENSIIENTNSSLMNIIITNVTSVPPEVFNLSPEPSLIPSVIFEKPKNNYMKNDVKPVEEIRKKYSPEVEDITQEPLTQDIPESIKVEEFYKKNSCVLQTIVSSENQNKFDEISNEIKEIQSEINKDNIQINTDPSNENILSEDKISSNDIKNSVVEIVKKSSPLKRKLNSEESECSTTCVSKESEVLNPPVNFIIEHVNKKRKIHSPSISRPYRCDKKIQHSSEKNYPDIYKNGMSLDHAAVVTVLGNHFVLPLNLEKSSMPSKSSPDISNYDGDAGTRPDDESRSRRPLNGFEDKSNCSKESDDHVDDISQGQISSAEANTCASRLMETKFLLKNLKFQVDSKDNLKIIVGETCSININIDSVSKSQKFSTLTKSPNQILNQQNTLNFNEEFKYSHSCKFESDAVKENLAPLGSQIEPVENDLVKGKQKKRFRDSSNDSTNSEDGLKERSYFESKNKCNKIIENNNNNNNNIPKLKKNNCNSSNVISKDPSNKSHRLIVSIDLSKISSFIESNPDIFKHHKKLFRCKSMSDFKNLTIHDCNNNILRRTKSLGSIPSINDNNNVLNLFESYKQEKKRIIRGFEKHDCVR